MEPYRNPWTSSTPSSSATPTSAGPPPTETQDQRRRRLLQRPWENQEESCSYELTVVQSPITGPAFGADQLLRIPVQPPLIVRLTIRDQAGRELDGTDEHPFLVGAVNLVTEGNEPADMLIPSPTRSAPVLDTPSVLQPPESSPSHHVPAAPLLGGEFRPVRMLAGSTTANVQKYQDLDGGMRFFLVFPEISVRTEGRYLLEVLLFRIPLDGRSTESLAETITPQALEIVPTPDYTCPDPSELTIHLQRQGAGQLAPPVDLQEQS